jgi:hypothetical protein
VIFELLKVEMLQRNELDNTVQYDYSSNDFAICLCSVMRVEAIRKMLTIYSVSCRKAANDFMELSPS